MSLNEIEAVVLAGAITNAGRSVPLNDVRQLAIGGVANVIRELDEDFRSQRGSSLFAQAEIERLKWQLECSEKDVANEKRRLAEMTEYRDNTILRLEMVERERDEARAEVKRLKRSPVKRGTPP